MNQHRFFFIFCLCVCVRLVSQFCFDFRCMLACFILVFSCVLKFFVWLVILMTSDIYTHCFTISNSQVTITLYMWCLTVIQNGQFVTDFSQKQKLSPIQDFILMPLMFSTLHVMLWIELLNEIATKFEIFRIFHASVNVSPGCLWWNSFEICSVSLYKGKSHVADDSSSSCDIIQLDLNYTYYNHIQCIWI